MKKMTRAERYKRNYALVRNAYNNATLAKRAQTWSDQRLYDELGIKTRHKTVKNVTLKPLKPKAKQSYYDKKLTNFVLGRANGLTVEQAKRHAYRRKLKAKIDFNKEYRKEIKETHNKGYTAKERRAELWKKWSSSDKGVFPPDLETKAMDYNAEQGFDLYDKYGFALAYYEFREGSLEIAKEIVKPDKYALSKYQNTRRIIRDDSE